jgi:hypothetical protein
VKTILILNNEFNQIYNFKYLTKMINNQYIQCCQRKRILVKISLKKRMRCLWNFKIVIKIMDKNKGEQEIIEKRKKNKGQ